MSGLLARRVAACALLAAVAGCAGAVQEHVTLPAAPRAPVALADSARSVAAADSSARAAAATPVATDTTQARTLGPPPPFQAAATDSIGSVTGRPDSTVSFLTRSQPAKKGAKAPEPPYRIEAAHMSGGRGPGGDVLNLEKVTITRSGTRLTSDRGSYERTTGMIHLDGNVKVRDSTTTVTCDQASFSENQDRVDLVGNVVVTDHDAMLGAPAGWYDRKNGLAQLTGGVRGREKKQRIISDEALYVRDSMLVHARGHVTGFDDENHTQLDAAAVDFDRRARVAVATGEPVLRSKDDDGHETLLRARVLRVGAETRVAEALDSVSVVRDTLQARADYARFDDNSGRGIMLGSPRAWDNETTMTGDTLETYAVKRELERVVVRGNATLDYAGLHENKGETSRLTGTRIDMYVSESKIDSLRAVGIARNAYTATPKEGKTAESNLTKGDTILVYFKDKKLDRARVTGGATGEYHPPVASGDTTAARLELVTYGGNHIDFVIPRNKIVLDGQAKLNYRDMELHAKRVEFDSQKNTLVAEGTPQLLEKGDEVDGQLMTYDLDRRVGTIYKASTTYERGLYHGKQIRKAGENELDVLGGAYSTCDLDQPHYHFSARWMKIYLKDKLVAKPVVFYLRNVPVLALPFYVFPIKPGRHSGFLFPATEFGFNNRAGQFIRNAGYYWAPNEYLDVTGSGDYFQAEPAWAVNGEANYKLLYAFDGHLETRFEHNDATGRDDYRFYGTHQQTLGQKTRLSALGNFTSSKQFNQDPLSAQSFADRVNRFLNSNVQLSHYADWISLSAVLDRQQDLDANNSLQDPDGTGVRHGPPVNTVAPTAALRVSQPSLSVSLPTRALGSYATLKDKAIGKALASTYLSLSGQFLSLETRQGFVAGTEKFRRPDSTLDSLNLVRENINKRRGAASTFSLSDSRRLFGWINFSPAVFGNAVAFDHDQLGHKLATGAVWQSSVGLGTTLYRTVGTPIRGLALRHVLSPSVGLSYSPDFPSLTFRDSLGVRRNRFDSFGGLGIFSGRKATRMNWSLDQRWQAKYAHGDKLTRLDNLLSWTTSGSYDFLWRQDGLAHPQSPISTVVRLQPPGYVNADASAAIDPYSQRPLRAFSYNLSSNLVSGGSRNPQQARLAADANARPQTTTDVTEFRESWAMSLAFSYNGGYAGPRWQSHEILNATLRYQLTENWVLDYQAGYDVTQRSLLLQRYNLTRRLHCWEAQFSRSFTPGNEAEYYFRLGIRDQREVYLERGTRVQSFGGIQ